VRSVHKVLSVCWLDFCRIHDLSALQLIYITNLSLVNLILARNKLYVRLNRGKLFILEKWARTQKVTFLVISFLTLERINLLISDRWVQGWVSLPWVSCCYIVKNLRLYYLRFVLCTQWASMWLLERILKIIKLGGFIRAWVHTWRVISPGSILDLCVSVCLRYWFWKDLRFGVLFVLLVALLFCLWLHMIVSSILLQYLSRLRWYGIVSLFRSSVYFSLEFCLAFPVNLLVRTLVHYFDFLIELLIILLDRSLGFPSDLGLGWIIRPLFNRRSSNTGNSLYISRTLALVVIVREEYWEIVPKPFSIFSCLHNLLNVKEKMITQCPYTYRALSRP